MANITSVSNGLVSTPSKQLVIRPSTREVEKQPQQNTHRVEAPFAGLSTDEYVEIDGRKLFFSAPRGTYLDIWV
ncbi:MAG: hypothetical protein MJ250_01850 [Alphaproteobacteria bacterium]|nr:hypothetical protein [Alphaproteobacteria bacterium]